MKKPVASVGTTALYEEKHYSPTELSALWSLSAASIRLLFEHEQGVIRLGLPSRRSGRGLKRSYYSIRIPASVAQRVHKRITAAVA
jgi:hypothetical protein